MTAELQSALARLRASGLCEAASASPPSPSSFRLPPIIGGGYFISRARYAKGMLAVRTPSNDGWMTPPAYVMRDQLNARWSNREGAYIASPAKVARFLEIMRSNENA